MRKFGERQREREREYDVYDTIEEQGDAREKVKETTYYEDIIEISFLQNSRGWKNKVILFLLATVFTPLSKGLFACNICNISNI